MYRVIRSIHATPARVALAPRYSRIEDAFANMGDGVVIADGGRVAAFHERHLRTIEAAGASWGPWATHGPRCSCAVCR